VLYNPAHEIPTRADAETGRRIVGMISRVDGDVFVPEHGYLACLAGKRPYAHRGAIDDVLRGDDRGIGIRLLDEIKTALAEKRYKAIFLDSNWRPYLGPKVFGEFYKEQAIEFPDDMVFRCLTGARIRPGLIYSPRRS
jgi:hypothetical protein